MYFYIKMVFNEQYIISSFKNISYIKIHYFQNLGAERQKYTDPNKNLKYFVEIHLIEEVLYTGFLYTPDWENNLEFNEISFSVLL